MITGSDTGAGVATTGGTGATFTLSVAWTPPITAKRAPTATVVSAGTSIEVRMPEAGDGISVSTLSVETSNNGSSTATLSPMFLSHRVTVPSVTDSPSAGIVTTVPEPFEAGAAGADGGGVTGAAATGAGVSTTGAAATGVGEDADPSAAMIASSVPTATV